MGSDLVDQPDWRPTKKIGASAAFGAAVLVGGYLAAAAGVDLPGRVLEAAVFLTMLAAGWLKRNVT